MRQGGDPEPEIAFETELLPAKPGGMAAYVHVPAELASVFGSKARVPVRITFRGHSFLASMGPRGNGDFYIVVNERMRDATGARVGDSVAVRIVRDDTPREVEVPPDLAAILATEAEAAAGWARLPFSRRNEMVEWITAAKRDETRRGRVETAADGLRTGKRLR